MTDSCCHINDICFTPDGRQIVVYYAVQETKKGTSLFGRLAGNTFSNEVRISVFDVKTRSLCTSFAVVKEHLCHGTMVLLPASRKLAVLCNELRGCRVRIYDIRCWAEICSFSSSLISPRLFAVPEEDLVGLAIRETIELWSWKKQTMARKIMLKDAVIQDIAISPDGCVLAARCTGSVRLFSMRRRLAFPCRVDWDWRADPYLALLLTVYPQPDEEKIRQFLRELQNCGLGYIREESVRAKILELQEQSGKEAHASGSMPGSDSGASRAEAKPEASQTETEKF